MSRILQEGSRFSSMIIAYHSAPGTAQARSMEQMGVTYAPPPADISRPDKPGEWLEYSPLLTLFVSGLGITYLIREVATLGPSVILELNHYVFAFLIAGMLLHWRSRSFVQAVAAAVPSVAGVRLRRDIPAGERVARIHSPPTRALVPRRLVDACRSA